MPIQVFGLTLYHRVPSPPEILWYTNPQGPGVARLHETSEPRNHGSVEPRKVRRNRRSPAPPTRKPPKPSRESSTSSASEAPGKWLQQPAKSPSRALSTGGTRTHCSQPSARAREDGAQKLVERIRLEAESGDWRAAAWLLERIEPGIYGRRVLVGGVAGSPIQIEGELKAGLAIRASVEATKLVHQALAIAAGTD